MSGRRVIEVLRPGLLSSVQDLGRAARGLGAVQAGALDQGALRLANALVGNPAGAAALEITGQGPQLRFGAEAVVALWGAPFDLRVDGKPAALGRALWLPAGALLEVGTTPTGLRAVLAVRGGLRAEALLGSRSTDLRAGFGGHGGRALRRGDRLGWPGPDGNRAPPALTLSAGLRPDTRGWASLRALPTGEGRPETLYGRSFTVGAQADRTGLRLSGGVEAAPDPLRLSEPNVVGAVQLPPDGAPILLLADAGTHGGYPTPLAVIAADHDRLAQLRPGDWVRFVEVSLVQARRLWSERQARLRRVEAALRWHWARAQG